MTLPDLLWARQRLRDEREREAKALKGKKG